MAEIRLQADLRQTLELLLSPRILQMLKILHLPYMELVEKISREAEENVMLEVEREDEYAQFIRYLTSDKKIRKEADFRELPGLENIGDVSKTLEKTLLEQLELEDLEPAHNEIAKEIIGNIDDRGYLLAWKDLRQRIMEKFKVSRPTVDKVLKIIQGFEPDGVGARDLKECLLIQIKAYNFETPALEKILEKAVKECLEDLSNQNYESASKKLGIPESGAIELANFIKNNLNPYPGSSFGEEVRHVIPSFAIERTDQGYQLVNLETHYGPKISISDKYLKMLEDPKTDEKTKAFLKEGLRRAKDLMEDISKRSEILEKIVRKIMGSQEVFLEKGMVWLRPLSQRSLADEFGRHPSTISRAVAEKYIQTPQGLFPLKFLCPRGPKGVTVGRIKAMLTEIIKNEDKNHPLSDAQITERMKEQGVKIDRRTAAYYRKELKIPTSERRENHG